MSSTRTVPNLPTTIVEDRSASVACSQGQLDAEWLNFGNWRASAAHLKVRTDDTLERHNVILIRWIPSYG